MTDKVGIHQYAYKIFPEQRFILVIHAGLMNMDAIKTCKEALLQDALFSSEFNLLIDMRSAKFNVQAKDSLELFEYISSRTDLVGESRKVAFFTCESEQVAMATVYKMLYKENHQKYRVFSALEDAMLWLHVNLMEDELMNELELLKEHLKA